MAAAVFLDCVEKYVQNWMSAAGGINRSEGLHGAHLGLSIQGWYDYILQAHSVMSTLETAASCVDLLGITQVL